MNKNKTMKNKIKITVRIHLVARSGATYWVEKTFKTICAMNRWIGQRDVIEVRYAVNEDLPHGPSAQDYAEVWS